MIKYMYQVIRRYVISTYQLMLWLKLVNIIHPLGTQG